MYAWGSVEVEPEVEDWMRSLDKKSFGQVAFAIDLLSREGVHLGEPHTRQLRGKLRELRFYVDGRRWRISYFIATGRRIVLLTVFPKTSVRERSEIERAQRAMERCLDERHTAEDEDE